MPTLMKEVDGAALSVEDRKPQIRTGDGTAWQLIESAAPRGQRQSFVPMRRVAVERVPGEKPRTGRALVAALETSGFIGMWADRADIEDSTEFARLLRERAWTRARNK